MKKILVLLSCILVSTIISAQEPNALTVKLRDGSTNSFILSERPIVTMPDTLMVIANEKVNAIYNRSEVEIFYFEYVDPTEIENVDETSVTFNYIDGKEVIVSGLKNNTVVSLTSIDGKNYKIVRCDEIGCVSISLESMPKGIYIVSFGKRSVKIKLD